MSCTINKNINADEAFKGFFGGEQKTMKLRNISSKRGIGPGDVTSWVTLIAVAIFVIVVFAIMLGALQTSLTSNSVEYNITGRGLTFLDNSTSKFGTAGTILGVLLLLGVIGAAGLGGYAAYKKSR